jgi:hypothetical protein
VREPYVGRSLAREAPRFAAAGLALPVAPALQALAEPALAAPPARPSAELAARAAALIDLGRRYAAEENLHVLRALAGAGGVSAGWDEALRLSWIRVELREGREVVRALILLSGADRGDVALAAGAAGLGKQLAAEIFRRPRVIRLAGSLP